MEGIIDPAFWIAACLLGGASVIIHGYIFNLWRPYTLEEALTFSVWDVMLEYLSIFFSAKSLAVISCLGSLICGFLYLVSKWIDDDEKVFGFGFLALIEALIAAIFAIGFIKFFEGVALILGIIGTIIGILVGLKKLSQR